MNAVYYLTTCIEREVEKLLREMKTRSAPEFDNISLNVIKLVQNELVHMITNLIRNVLDCGQYSEELKIAKVQPIFKKLTVSI